VYLDIKIIAHLLSEVQIYEEDYELGFINWPPNNMHGHHQESRIETINDTIMT
jgi:hypothetical protein